MKKIELKQLIKESIEDILIEETDLSNIYVKNPETGNKILATTALQYGKKHPAYSVARKKALQVAKKQGKKEYSKEHKKQTIKNIAKSQIAGGAAGAAGAAAAVASKEPFLAKPAYVAGVTVGTFVSAYLLLKYKLEKGKAGKAEKAKVAKMYAALTPEEKEKAKKTIKQKKDKYTIQGNDVVYKDKDKTLYVKKKINK